MKNRYYDPAKPHHRPDGFQNNDGDFRPRSLGEVLRWKADALRAGFPPRPRTPTPVVAPDLPFLHANAKAALGMQPAISWIGHSTVLAQLGGITMLTDPVFSERVSPVAFAGPKRHVAPAMKIAELPHIDLVVISHNHYDHLDAASVDALAKQPGGSPLFVVPLGLGPWLAGRGIRNAVELDWWDKTALHGPFGDIDITLVPAQHWSSRSLGDRMATLWGGFAVLAHDCHLMFAGDTAYSRDFTEIRRRFAARQTPEAGGGFDIALLPIGAYAPRWFMANQHVDVQEAIRIHLDLGAKRSLGVHWGTYELTDEALDDPPIQLAAQRPAHGLSADDFFVLAIGETRLLPPRR